MDPRARCVQPQSHRPAAAWSALGHGYLIAQTSRVPISAAPGISRPVFHVKHAPPSVTERIPHPSGPSVARPSSGPRALSAAEAAGRGLSPAPPGSSPAPSRCPPLLSASSAITFHVKRVGDSRHGRLTNRVGTTSRQVGTTPRKARSPDAPLARNHDPPPTGAVTQEGAASHSKGPCSTFHRSVTHGFVLGAFHVKHPKRGERGEPPIVVDGDAPSHLFQCDAPPRHKSPGRPGIGAVASAPARSRTTRRRGVGVRGGSRWRRMFHA